MKRRTDAGIYKNIRDRRKELTADKDDLETIAKYGEQGSLRAHQMFKKQLKDGQPIQRKDLEKATLKDHASKTRGRFEQMKRNNPKMQAESNAKLEKFAARRRVMSKYPVAAPDYLAEAGFVKKGKPLKNTMGKQPVVKKAKKKKK